MPGDAVIANPTHSAMQAVTVSAPPADIWPWLVQIGYQRGGLYSYDWLDRLLASLTVRVRLASFPSFSSSPWVTRFCGGPPALSPAAWNSLWRFWNRFGRSL